MNEVANKIHPSIRQILRPYFEKIFKGKIQAIEVTSKNETNTYKIHITPQRIRLQDPKNEEGKKWDFLINTERLTLDGTEILESTNKKEKIKVLFKRMEDIFQDYLDGKGTLKQLS